MFLVVFLFAKDIIFLWTRFVLFRQDIHGALLLYALASIGRTDGA